MEEKVVNKMYTLMHLYKFKNIYVYTYVCIDAQEKSRMLIFILFAYVFLVNKYVMLTRKTIEAIFKGKVQYLQ